MIWDKWEDWMYVSEYDHDQIIDVSVTKIEFEEDVPLWYWSISGLGATKYCDTAYETKSEAQLAAARAFEDLTKNLYEEALELRKDTSKG